MKIVLIILALLYFLFPFDLIRDYIPFAGYIDDVAILLWVIYILKNKINRPNTSSYHSNTSNFSQKDKKKVKNSYKILGLDNGADKDDVKKAYRELAAKYHPDKTAHLGQELQDFARQKFIEINNAYEDIKREQGW